jgi:hypothetical protein
MLCKVNPQTMDIADMTIQVGGAWEGQSFALKIQHWNFGK